MDILNELPAEQFENIDDLLAFVSIYDDEKRTEAYLDLLDRHRDEIKGAVCVEAGCGFGVLSAHLAKLGAGRVYAVEINPHLAAVARNRLADYSVVHVVEKDIRSFVPPEPVDVLVHELFGQLLFDEDLYSLARLNFRPTLWVPDEARLELALLDSRRWIDHVVTSDVLAQTQGALISGLFDADRLESTLTVMHWTPDFFPKEAVVDLKDKEGDLLAFFLTIYHQGKIVCRAGECDNWATVWTVRNGNRFRLRFKPSARGATVHFEWSS